MTETQRLHQVHADVEDGTKRAMEWLRATVGTENTSERDAARDLFEKNAFALHVLDEIIYGKARHLSGVLKQ